MLALTTARNWGQLGSGGGGKRESDALELGTWIRNKKLESSEG